MYSDRGIALVEIILAVAVVAVVVTMAAQTSVVSFRSADVSRERSQAVELVKEGLEALRAVRDFDNGSSQGWNRIYLPPDGTGNAVTGKGSGNPYYLKVSGSNWILTNAAADGEIPVGDITYTRKIIIDNVSRDISGTIESIYNSSRDDPSTQKITIQITKPESSAVLAEASDYFSRSRNDVCPQTNWDPGASATVLPAPNAGNCYNNSKYESKTDIDTTVTSGSLKLSQ